MTLPHSLEARTAGDYSLEELERAAHVRLMALAGAWLDYHSVHELDTSREEREALRVVVEMLDEAVEALP